MAIFVTLFRLFVFDFTVSVALIWWTVTTSVIGDAAGRNESLVGNLQDEVGPAYIEHLGK